MILEFFDFWLNNMQNMSIPKFPPIVFFKSLKKILGKLQKCTFFLYFMQCSGAGNKGTLLSYNWSNQSRALLLKICIKYRKHGSSSFSSNNEL